MIGRPFLKQFALIMLSNRRPSVCPVLSVRLVYCGQTNQDETWDAGRPGPWPHCVREGPSFSSPKGGGHNPQFSAHICCGQMAGWIKIPLGMEIGLGPGDFILGGDPIPPPQKGGGAPLPNFRPMSIVAKRLDGSRWHLAWRWVFVHATLCKIGTQLLSPKRGRRSPISGPFLLRPNGCMHQDATSYGGRPQPRRLCVGWDTTPPP